VEHGLDLLMPQKIRRCVSLDTNFDRWTGLPTVTADCFFPVRAWKDKSVFFSPRVSLGAHRESLSMGVGLRRLLTGEAMIGFYGFHDWVRPRGSNAKFLREAGIGVELAALPGHYSDLTISANAYFPVNRRSAVRHGGGILVNETLPRGADARLEFQLPGLIDPLTTRIRAQAHSYRAEHTDLTGYEVGFSLETRDGMLTVGVEQGRDTEQGHNFRVEGTLNLALDWQALAEGKLPFSAPYEVPERRFSRSIPDTLGGRVVRNHDLPTERSRTWISLAANVMGDTVSFTGVFPRLPNERLTLQVASSPWRDRMGVVTDSRGCYSGKLNLPPGKYRLRLVHSPSGRMSAVRTVMIRDQD